MVLDGPIRKGSAGRVISLLSTDTSILHFVQFHGASSYFAPVFCLLQQLNWLLVLRFTVVGLCATYLTRRYWALASIIREVHGQ